MKHIKGFYEKINEAKISIEDTKSTNFTTGSLIQIVDENDKNIGQAEIKKVLKTMYHVKYRRKLYKINRKDLSINIHGQIQSELKNLKE